MLAQDAADSPLASYRPDPADACDSLRSLLSYPFDTYTGTLPASHVELRVLAGRLLDRGVEIADEAGCLESGGAAPAGEQAILIEFLLLMSRDEDRHYALRALCYLRLLGREGRSFDAIGKLFGVGRSNVQNIYRQLQKRHGGMSARGDKSPASREACRRRRLGARKTHLPWAGRHIWKSPLRLTA